MPLPRILPLALRSLQILLATIVLGLTGYFLHHRNKFSKTNDEPFGRLVFSVVLSSSSLTHALSTLFSAPHTTIAHIALDMLFATGYFTIFALFTDSYTHNLVCQSLYEMANPGVWRDTCAQWNAAQAFSFLAAVVWLGSIGVGGMGWLAGRKEGTVNGVNAVNGTRAGAGGVGEQVRVNGDAGVAPRRRWLGRRGT